jgi:thiol-disulfide isomerase/thioredoxin
MRYLLWSTFSLSVIILGCNSAQKDAESSDFELVGTVAKPLSEKYVYLKLATDSGITDIDSAFTDKEGKFRFVGKPEEDRLYVLDIYGKQNIPLFLNPGKITITTDGEERSPNYTIEGSPNSLVFKQFEQLRRAFDKETEQLEAMYQNMRTTGNDLGALKISLRYDSLQATYKSDLKKLIWSAGVSPVAYLATGLLSTDEDFEFLDSLEKRFVAEKPEAYYTKKMTLLLEVPRKLTMGNPVPDLELETPEGKKISISSLKGKVVLVDFWASWCKPCRQENPNVVKLYDKYKAKDFEILGVSLDNDKDRWIKAIADDKLSWKHISDLKGWQSKACSTFNVSSIPFTLLIDKEGKLIAKGLRGEALENKLKEIFGS